jgi:hypothetical protein
VILTTFSRCIVLKEGGFLLGLIYIDRRIDKILAPYAKYSFILFLLLISSCGSGIQ